jgi:CubicO group peptidase (beta-lactamase class C family)
MEADDPETLGWMAGFPPPADKLIRFADGTYYAWPQLRWSFSHMQQLVPGKPVWRGPGAARELPSEPRNFDHLEIGLADGGRIGWADMLSTSHTDALAILHRGRLVYEEYFGACGPHVQHIMMSCNKSMVGTIAECLIEDGSLDDSALVPTIVPELTDSAWGDATVRQVLDMVVSMVFHEDYLIPDSDVWKIMRASGMAPGRPEDPATIADFLPGVRKDGRHGEVFAYREPNIFVLGWIVRRAADDDLATLASDLVWRHLGAEHDWLYMIDAGGAETTASATLRDFVRFGELFADRGRIGDIQVLPTRVAAAILAGGDRDVFARGGYETLPGWSYRSQWWYRHIDHRVCPVARGAHGQVLYIDPANDLVIARFGSSPQAPSVLLDRILIPMIDAITSEVIR